MNKIIILILMLIGLVSGVNSALTDELYVHHMFQNNTLDSSGAGRTGTLTLGTYVPGKVGNGILIDASTEYFTFATLTGIYDTDVSICAWISNNDATAYLGYSVNTGHGGTNNVLNLGLNSNVIGYYDGSWRNSGTAFQTGWRFVCWVFDDSSAKYEPWLDNVNLGNVTYGGLVDFKGVFTINRNGQSDLSATVDEFSVWNRTITATEIGLLYNSGNGLNFSNWTIPTPAGALTFLNISVNNVTFLDNSYYNITQLNFTTLMNASGTNNQTNQTFYLHNSTGQLINSTQFATNTLSGSFKLNLSEGVYNIWIFGNNNESNVSSSNYTFTIDKTPPVIQQIANISEGVYAVNFSTIFNVTDAISGLSNCIINITELENVTLPDNFIINCTDTQVFNSSGLHNAFVIAIDNANNQNTLSYNFTIRPFTNISFNDTQNSLIVTNYTATIFHPDGRETTPIPNANGIIQLSPVNNGTLDLGVHIIEFAKAGYVTQNFTYNITSSSANTNVIFNVSIAKIIINIYDRTTGLSLSGVNVTINLQGVGNRTTSTGNTSFQNFSISPNSYHVEAIANGYYTEGKDFDYTGQSNAIVNLFLLNSTKSGVTTLIVPVIDEFFNIIEGSDTRLLEYDINILGFKEVSQCDTNSNGECKFLIEVGTKRYIVTTSKNINGVLFNAQSTQNGEIFLADISDGTVIPGEIFLNNLVLKISSTLPPTEAIGLRITTPETVNDTIVSENSTATVVNIPISYIADNGLSYTVCLEFYRFSGTSLTEVISPVCDTGASGILPTSNIILNNDFKYKALVTYYYEGEKIIYTSYDYSSSSDFIELLLEQGYVSSFILLFWIILLSVCLYLCSIGTWVYGAWILSVVQGVIFLNVLVSSLSVLIIIINIGVLYISRRQGDTL